MPCCRSFLKLTLYCSTNSLRKIISNRQNEQNYYQLCPLNIKVGKKAENTHISQDGGKYWEFLGNTEIYWVNMNQIKPNQINFIGSKSSHRTLTIHIQYTNTIIQRGYTVYKYVHVKHNYYMCIRHVSVAPLYIMSVKRWVQVCTFIESSVQIHSQSNLSWHQIPVIACIWLAMTLTLTVFI